MRMVRIATIVEFWPIWFMLGFVFFEFYMLYDYWMVKLNAENSGIRTDNLLKPVSLLVQKLKQ